MRQPAKPDASIGEFPLFLTISLFALVFLFPAWPWLSGAVTIPWDAKSTFLPPLQFLATSLATGQSPFWTPNVFAGWPLISDPQSLIFSPLHLLLAYFDRTPGFRAVDSVTFIYLFAGGTGIILYFRDRGWHAAGALVAALAFAFGCAANSRLQHTGQIISLAYFPLTLWMLARALERSSWRAGAVAGILGGLLALGRDQVALLSIYVLVGFVLAHWLGGKHWQERVHASVKPLAAGCIAGALVAAVPIIMTTLLAARSNRPEIGLMFAERGSLHPAHLLTLAFADLFAAMDPVIDYWGPGTAPWKAAALGGSEITLAKNMGLVYMGALPLVVISSFGIVRGIAWSRDIRFFTIATGVVLLYALGSYTPAFQVMYDLLPCVTLYRRPADATFVIGALLAFTSGYLVHRWLEGTVPLPNRLQRGIEFAIPVALVALALWLAHTVMTIKFVAVPVVTALVFMGSAIAVLFFVRSLKVRSPFAAMIVLSAVMAVDLAWNNAPHMSTGIAPSTFDALRLDTKNETLALLRSKLAATAAPDRRDRVELIVAYHWPNLCMIQSCDHAFGHNPLRLKTFYDATRVGDTLVEMRQRTFSPLFPSYRSAFADLLGLRFIAVREPIEKIDSSLQPGDLALIRRTNDAYIYENPRALPRVMLLTDWRIADFDQLLASGWPSDVDPRHTVLLKRAPAVPQTTAAGAAPGSARLTRYANSEVEVSVDAPSGGILLLNDVWHPWWRATVDGKPSDILKANVIFRAVTVPPGRHTVRFTFHPFAGTVTELAGKLRDAR